MLPPDYVQALSQSLEEIENGECESGLSGWGDHCGYGDRYEVAITESLCPLLKKRGFVTRNERWYDTVAGRCDLVSCLLERTEAWIEAKVYWTVYFNKNGRLVSSRNDEKWDKRIPNLINQCKSRLEPMYKSSGGATKVAGLLIGLEKLNTEVVAPRLYNPTAAKIDGFLRKTMSEYSLPWTIQPLWGASIMRRSTICPQVIVVSRPLLLIPPDTF
jgi:hypothetical protein